MKSKKGQYIGDCPLCGDEVYVYRSKRTRGRYCRCLNPDCPFSGPMPRRGHLMDTGQICEKYEGVIVGVETYPTDNPADARRYFWVSASRPMVCQECREYSTCPMLNQAIEMLDEDLWARA